MPPQAPPPWTPGAPPPTGGSGRKGLWIALAVVGVLVLIGAAVVLGIVVFGGDDSSSDSGSDSSTSGSTSGSSDQAVDAVVTQFLDAAKTNDCDAIQDIITDHFKSVIGECDSMSSDTLDSYTIDDTRVDDSAGTAEVDATATESGEDLPLTFKLVDESGQWKIDDFDLSGTDIPSASVPTDLPTDFLSDLPTDFPTDFPSGFPTDFPTDPSELESYIESYLGSLTASP